MKLIDQHTKGIMEGCKERAIDAGLSITKDSLEYIVTNIDMLELSPKNMIPTLYDYWLNEIKVLRGKGEYEVYPNNPYETVINTRPPISFYNQNNPDWLNVMIFYHVIGHIDFFQNNIFFEKTWDYDFKEKALTEKRMIARLRSQKGREVDYVIEFGRSIDNLVGFHDDLRVNDDFSSLDLPPKVHYYFHTFLQEIKKVGMREFLAEIDRYNKIDSQDEPKKIERFFQEIQARYPEINQLYKEYRKEKEGKNHVDLYKFILDESKFLNEEKNVWMKSILEVIRETALYFSPMIRTKTMNEGWASYWHEKLFMNDDRINGHEVAFARINAKVTSISKVGLNPYAIGWRLFMYIEEQSNKGRYSYEFNKLHDIQKRKIFDRETDEGLDFLFHVRKNYCDSTFLNLFIDQDFVDKHKLMVVGQRVNPHKMVKEYYVKSRKAKDYKAMINENLYHPPHIEYRVKEDGTLYLNHTFEGKEIFKDYIHNTMLGLEYLWGNRVQLETTELDWEKMKKENKISDTGMGQVPKDIEPIYRRVRYSMKNKKSSKIEL